MKTDKERAFNSQNSCGGATQTAPPDWEQRANDSIKYHGATQAARRLGADAAFAEIADYLQEQKLYVYAEHIRKRISTRPQEETRAVNRDSQFEAMVGALEEIAARKSRFNRCCQCGYKFFSDGTERHSESCAQQIATTALSNIQASK